MCIRDRPRTANDFQGVSSSATERGKIVLIVGPTFGIIFKTPAIKALAITSFIPSKYRPIETSIATHIELSKTPVIQLLKAFPHFNKIVLARLLLNDGTNNIATSLYEFGCEVIINPTEIIKNN